ncbi:hypothetical protein Vadar_023738 [Vaccinium darrowii]|uniref:Uncharacterized protein n=1 Tax=Vaccinium darrowii TaxID=229202 RepID=A0ACB7ZLG3_9ERIC|nr:hypothetical protein Vadar_023738 [Vaccinium darrowii]
MTFCLRVFLILLVVGIASAQLSTTFYSSSCPKVLTTIKSAVDSAVSKEARMGAFLLRLHFHDCFVNGCDGSVLLDGSTGEKFAGPNANSLRGFKVIDTIKSQVESLCPGVVSCADILTVAARDSVIALGGPSWSVPLGRRDSATANQTAASSNLPSPDSSLNTLITAFSKQSADGDGDDNLSPLDVTSPTLFDNAYFKNLQSQKGLLHSDQELFNGGSTDGQVNAYSTNSASFFRDFANAMVKMGNLSPLTGTNGQIRTNCRKAN